MAEKIWEPIKVRFCEHRNCEVALEVQAIYPSDVLPDMGPRLEGHRCSMGMKCNDDNSACVWSGTNPTFDPFI